MESVLSPLEFARRARALYAHREAVVDGDRRFTYAQFFDRVDRWSHALQRLGVGPGDRVAYIAPNTHAHLEGYYAVPQLGAVIVPLNYRLLPSDWVYMINHSGSRVVCVHEDYLAQVQAVRHELPQVEHVVALEGEAEGFASYEALLEAAGTDVARPAVAEGDLVAINYTSGTTSRPKGVMVTHRNVWVNAVGTLVHHPMTSADRYLWTLPMFHANGWTFTWIVTAVGGTHVCLRKVDAAGVFGTGARERVTVLCAAPTVRAGAHRRRAPRRRHDRAGGGGAGVDHHPRVRAHRDLPADDRLRAAPRGPGAPSRRARAAQGPAGGGADHVGGGAGDR